MKSGKFLWSSILRGDDVNDLKMALKGSVTIHTMDTFGNLVLHEAIWTRKWKCVDFLILANADIFAKDQFGRSSLHYACWSGSVGCVKLLIGLGAHVNARDCESATPLIYLCKVHWGMDILDELLKHGAKINAQDVYSYTLLDYVMGDTLFYDPHELILRGAWFNRTKKKQRPHEWVRFRTSLALCRLATVAVSRALTKQKRIHKDVIPMIAALVWATKENELLWCSLYLFIANP